MDSFLFLYIALGIFFFLIALLPSYRSIWTIIQIHRTPTSPIALLPNDGRVEVVGKTWHRTTTRSVLTHSACVFWQAQIIQTRMAGKSGTNSVTVLYNDTSGSRLR